MPVIRPMTEDDVEGALEVTNASFADLDRRNGREPEPPPDPEVALIRYRHLVRTDPGGAWVAEDDEGIAGCALALLREGVWGLSLLVVRPGLQSAGVGSGLLHRAHEYADGARGRIILASTDARAMRAYKRLGLDLHPTLSAGGVPRDVAVADGLREGTRDDIPLTEAVDRHVRGAAHGPDIGVQLDMGQRLLIADDRGYAVVGEGGGLRLLAAVDDDTARDLLRAALARTEKEAFVPWMSARQQWAIDVCLEAGLSLRYEVGPIFVGGDVGPFTPYLPSGAFL